MYMYKPATMQYLCLSSRYYVCVEVVCEYVGTVCVTLLGCLVGVPCWREHVAVYQLKFKHGGQI